MWLCWFAAAHAAVPVADPVFPLAGRPTALALGPVDGGALLVATSGGIAALSPSTGALLAEQAGVTADHLLLLDRDADGRLDVVGCGAGGLFWMPWSVGGLLCQRLLGGGDVRERALRHREGTHGRGPPPEGVHVDFRVNSSRAPSGSDARFPSLRSS
jgi:hypothetical protein